MATQALCRAACERRVDCTGIEYKVVLAGNTCTLFTEPTKMLADGTPAGTTCALPDARQFSKNAGTCVRVAGGAAATPLNAKVATTLAECKIACLTDASCVAYQWLDPNCHTTTDGNSVTNSNTIGGSGVVADGECWTMNPTTATSPLPPAVGLCELMDRADSTEGTLTSDEYTISTTATTSAECVFECERDPWACSGY